MTSFHLECAPLLLKFWFIQWPGGNTSASKKIWMKFQFTFSMKLRKSDFELLSNLIILVYVLHDVSKGGVEWLDVTTSEQLRK